MNNEDTISRAAAVAIIEAKQKELCPLGMFSRNAVYGTDRERFDAWQEIADEIDGLPSVPPQVVHGSPCDLCRYNPPSSCDGKPCTMCPAEAKMDGGEDNAAD